MSEYIDTSAIVQVIGNIFNNNQLLDDEKYSFSEEDFPKSFHKVLFGAIYNLHLLDTEKVTINAIEDYLSQRPNSYAVYKANKGGEYLLKVSESASLSTFDYYYNRMKKMGLLQAYSDAGVDVSDIYDPDNILDVKKKQTQEDWIDNTPIEKIADLIDLKVEDIKNKYLSQGQNIDSINAGENIFELLENFQKVPDVGYPLYGSLINTITRGARLKKFYLRSAATNVGKTRTMIADAASIAYNEIYDTSLNKWIPNNTIEPVLFVATEQEASEVQTMILAFLSGVNEEHIVKNRYEPLEFERVKYAAEVMKKGKLYVQELPDFSLQDVEKTLKREIRNHEVKYVFMDYIHTSIKILSEISSKSGVRGLREDNILFLISAKLKDLANQYGIFIASATQLNGQYQDAKEFDQNLLRGSKAIADKADFGEIMLEVTQEDEEMLQEVVNRMGYPMPNIKRSIYKNRANEWKRILLWCYADKGCCRYDPLFVTNYKYELLYMEDLKINIK